jgi:Subtilase family
MGLAMTTASAVGAAKRSAQGELSPRLAELAMPTVRSAPRSEQAEAVGLVPRGPGSLLRRGNRVLVEVLFGSAAPIDASALRAVGSQVIETSPELRTVTAAVRPDELQRLNGVRGVTAVTEILTPIAHAAGEGDAVSAATTPCFGAATSEGDEQLRAAKAREEFALDGSGEKVGILSDSFDRDVEAVTDAGDDVSSGDLPGTTNPCGRTNPVQFLSDPVAGSDEGRGMAQIVHDLAPGADISFATAFTGLNAFADNVRALSTAGASVIVDDVSYFEEPFFQEGPVGVAVSDVTEEGVSYFSAAGNSNLIRGGKNIASWEAPEFRDSGSCPGGLSLPEYASNCVDFDPGAGVDPTFGITVSPGGTLSLDLQWAQPWYGVTTDLDAYLVDAGGAVVSESENVNSSTERPYELVSWTNESSSANTVRLAISRCGIACDPIEGGDEGTPRLKFVMLENDVAASEYPEGSGGDIVGPTIYGHSGAERAMSLGATRYNATSAPETFSSRGPVTHYFEPVDGSTPAEPLAEGLQLAKPDVVATDGGANTFFGSCVADAWRFFGTSAAAPHAAAVAALELEAEPDATPDEVKDAQIESAVAVGGFGPEAIGAGRIDAVGAIQQLGVVPTSPGAEPLPTPANGPCFAFEPDPDLDDDENPPSPDAPPPASPPALPPVAAPDRLAPQTFIKRRPAKTIRTRFRRGRAVFVFRSSERGAVFVCQFDRRRARRCGPRFVRWFRPGRHVLRVRARDFAGNADPTPAVYRFRVRRARG